MLSIVLSNCIFARFPLKSEITVMRWTAPLPSRTMKLLRIRSKINRQVIYYLQISIRWRRNRRIWECVNESESRRGNVQWNCRGLDTVVEWVRLMIEGDDHSYVYGSMDDGVFSGVIETGDGKEYGVEKRKGMIDNCSYSDWVHISIQYIGSLPLFHLWRHSYQHA